MPSERVAYTFECEGMPGHGVLESVTFVEHDGKTKLTVRSLFGTVEDPDGMLRSRMEAAAAETFDRLDEHLAQMKS